MYKGSIQEHLSTCPYPVDWSLFPGCKEKEPYVATEYRQGRRRPLLMRIHIEEPEPELLQNRYQTTSLRSWQEDQTVP